MVLYVGHKRRQVAPNFDPESRIETGAYDNRDTYTCSERIAFCGLDRCAIGLGVQPPEDVGVIIGNFVDWERIFGGKGTPADRFSARQGVRESYKVRC
jgi:hypothetical protein